MTTTKQQKRTLVDAAADHLRSYAITDKQLAFALDVEYDSLRRKRSRQRDITRRSRIRLPSSLQIRLQNWTLIDDVERTYPFIVERCGGPYDPETENQQQWVERFGRAYSSFKREQEG